MAVSFYFYDLETSGVSPKDSRIMQFGGQRTDMNLKPVGEPHNVYVKLTEDILPDPDAILLTGITPQKTIVDGITEAEFLKLFYEEIALPDTIFIGFNSIRFDDEFMRYLHYRNFYDPYEWQWSDGRSRWDLLDLVRMTRALRPDGIEWPFDSSGVPSNRLQLLTSVNKLEHTAAHDALSDVQASIAVARLIYNKQTKLFDYLLTMRSKQKVGELVKGNEPFIYTSGRYSSEFEKTTVVATIAERQDKQGVLVYDLRYDPTKYLAMSPEELVEEWRWKEDKTLQRLPVKTLRLNRSPAVAPLGVLDEVSQKRLKLDVKATTANLKKLRTGKDFAKSLHKALEILDEQLQSRLLSDELSVDGQMYDGFISNEDKITCSAVRAAEPNELVGFKDELKDQRLKTLLPLYKARNFPRSLTPEEHKEWDAFRLQKLTNGKEKSRLHTYMTRLQELSKQSRLTAEKQYLLEELQLYAESILPDFSEDGS